MTDKVHLCEDVQIKKDWEYLQASDHFYYMATKFFSDGAVHAYFNPYDTPYDAFMNYMNVLSDFEIRLNRFIPDRETQNEISKLNNLIKEKESIIDQQSSQIESLKKKAPAKKKSARLSSSRTKSTGKAKTTKAVKSKKNK